MTGKVIIRQKHLQKHLQKLRDRREALREETQTQKRDRAIAGERRSKRQSEVRKLAPVEWTKEFTIEFFQKFESIPEVRAAMRGPMAYEKATTNGWLTDCCRHMFKKPRSYVWTLEELKERATPHNSRSQFQAEDSQAFYAAKKMGVLDELCPNTTAPIPLEDLKASARKYERRSDWQMGDKSMYAAAQRRGLLEDCCAHMEPVPDRIKKRAKQGTWTQAKCLASARQFTSRSEWEAEDGKAYYAAVNQGWMDEIAERLEWFRAGVDRKPSGYWCDPLRCILDAKQYETRSEWEANSGAAYNSAMYNGWFESCVAHMKPVTAKPRGYWEDATNWPELIERAQKFGNRKDWMEGDHASYTAAYKINGQLWKDCAAHMERYSGAKADAIYVWRPTSMPDRVLSVLPGFHLVKFGATSTELIALCETSEGDAFAFESVLKGLGVTPAMPYWYDGKTEFRLISDSEMQLVMELLGVEEAQAEAA